MAENEPKEPGRSPPRDVEDFKARLGLKVPRRAPVVAPPPPAPPAPSGVPDQPVAPVPSAGQAAPPPAPRPRAPEPPPPPVARPVVAPELFIEEPTPRVPAWKRLLRPAAYGLIAALLGAVVGYVFGKGAQRGAMLAKVRSDAVQILEVVRHSYDQVEQVGGILDPEFAKARAQRKDLPPVRSFLRRAVDWAALDTLGRIEAPRDLEKIFETDYQRFTRHTVKLLTGFFVDFSRLTRLVADHVERTRSARALLEGESKAGATPRVHGVIISNLPSLEIGEVVVVRGQRTVRKGKEDVDVFDVARRNDPGTPIAVPGNSLVILRAQGLFKEAGSLLEEYNRRLVEIADVVRRLLEIRRSLVSALEKIAEIQV
jgi:hypothetical protein